MEHINFTMHANLLRHVIESQAATLAKAIGEGAMNAEDAKATTLDLTIKKNEVRIVDNGRGFRSRKEIEEWFRQFGTPHEERERKKYAAFRMGRGQMFNFGKNTWRTGKFTMVVDIRDDSKENLGFGLKTNKKSVKGCGVSIDLYDELLPSALEQTIREVTQFVRYMPIQVKLNGEHISLDPEGEEWDHNTADAWIRLGTGDMELYNMGVYVRSWPAGRFGTGGVIVTKKKLDLIFDRNDVKDRCPIWKRIKQLVTGYSTRQAKKTPTLNAAQRRMMIDQLRHGTTTWDGLTDKKLFTAASGRHYSLYQLMDQVRSCPSYTHAAEGNRKADKLMQTKTSFVFADECIERWGVDPKKPDAAQQMVAAIIKTLGNNWRHYSEQLRFWEYIPFAKLAAEIKSNYSEIPEDKLTVNERVWLALIKGMYSPWSDFRRTRRYAIGRSDEADGWTDGKTYICINRNFLKKWKFNLAGIQEVADLLHHEYCHDDSDSGTHVHSQEFYENYHDQQKCRTQFVTMAVSRLPAIMKRIKKKVDKVAMQEADRQALLEQEAKKLPKAARRS